MSKFRAFRNEFWAIRNKDIYFDKIQSDFSYFLKGQLHGEAEIFKGLKMTFRTKILKKKLYHVNQRQKYYKLCFDNFSL